MDLNKVSIIGNVFNTPSTKRSEVHFTVITNYIWNDKGNNKTNKSVESHDIIARGHTAEVIKEYVKKGSKVYVEGHLITRMVKPDIWQTYVMVEDIIMLGHRKGKSNA